MEKLLPFRHRRLFSDRKTRVRHIFIVLLAVSIAVLIFIYLFNLLIGNAVREIAKAEAINAATEMINSTVNELISEENISYSGLVSLNFNDKGEIVSADTNTVLLNCLRTELSKIILEKFSTDERLKFSIPIGSLMKNEMLSGRGPNIWIKVKKAGEIKTDTSSSFTDAGINQTCHRIFLNVSLSFTILLPSGSEKVTLDTSVAIAETIIVGNVPSAYISQAKN